MTQTLVRSGELVFVKCVKDGIPNRDPLRESDARRVFGDDDGRISLTDVSIKRDVRDYVLARFADGGKNPNYHVFVQKVLTPEGKLLGRGGLADRILEAYRQARPAPSPPPEEKLPRKKGKAPDTASDDKSDLLAAAFDMRVFGAVFSVKNKSFSQTGPVQFGWAHSLHPVETKYVQGTVCMPSEEASASAAETEASSAGKTAGTIWTQYYLPFAVFAMPGVINAKIAEDTGMTEHDVTVLLEGLWQGTRHRQARGRGIQRPLFLLHVEYHDPFFRIGFLDEAISLIPGRDADGRARWLGGSPPTDLAHVVLDVTQLAARLHKYRQAIARARYCLEPELRLQGSLPDFVQLTEFAAPGE
ncbi:MAG: CRISPR-associated protein [Gemmataceae bacterium]